MSNKQKPDNPATPLAPTFLDDDSSPLAVPRMAMRYQLKPPHDMTAWATSDAGPTATTDDESLSGGDREPASRDRMNLATKKKLDAMFLPELHQARWAQQMGELRDVQRHATTPETQAAAQAAIMNHYNSRHDLDATRRRLKAEYKAREVAERVERARRLAGKRKAK